MNYFLLLMLLSLITVAFARPNSNPWFVDTRSPPSKRVLTTVFAANGTRNGTVPLLGANCTLISQVGNTTVARVNGTTVALNGTLACLNGTLAAASKNGTNSTAATGPVKAVPKGRTRIVRLN